MTSEAVVASLVARLGDLLIKEAQLLHGVGDQVRGIQRELQSMRCFLKDADSKQKEDDLVKNWVAQIRDVSYEAEDVIEIFIYSQRRRRGFVGRVKRYICILSELRTLHKVAQQIEKIKLNTGEISTRRETYGIRNINEVGASSSSQRLQDRRGLFTAREDSESEVVGLQDEVDHVKKQLMTGETRRCVISIFGMGGLGKTTLAKKVYHDVKKQFECHAFIYLSQKFAIKDVLMRIIKRVTSRSKEEIEKLNLEELSTMLQDDLKEKKYLVVVDDIWSIEAWETIKLILPEGKESRVMLTTRNEEVASHADRTHRHNMRFLNSKEGWELFMKKIFPGQDPLTACPSELKETGGKILEKCGGLPLPILVLGGLLQTKEQTIREWSNVLASVPRHLTDRYELCMKILALSYWDLPYQLKPCFLYLGLFPEDYEIGSGKLIRLWIAEGFIQQREDEIMEDTAEKFLEELVSRSMIQVASSRSNGSIHKCRIHDLLRAFSISEAKENNFFVVLRNDNDTSSSSTSVRRLSVYRNIDGDETKNHSIETLRSIFYFFDSKVDVLKLPNKSSKLRVINAESEVSSEVSLPKEMGEFVHLKFLEVSRQHYSFRSIPPSIISPSIGNLSSLQTLKVNVERGVILPNTIWSLKELRHLQAYFSHIKGPPHLSNLTNLQTLYLTAGSWIKEGLGKLTNLRRLGILGDVSSYRDTLPRCIEKLRNLRSLKLTEFRDVTGSFSPLFPFTHHPYLYRLCLTGSLEKLPEMPPNLVELVLLFSNLGQDAIFTLEKLQHLKILTLDVLSYNSKQMICPSGGFPRLELLKLFVPLETWIVEEDAMISLKSVESNYLPSLKTEILPERVRALLKEVNYSNEEEKRSVNETGREKTR